jgi:hypothetical protein
MQEELEIAIDIAARQRDQTRHSCCAARCLAIQVTSNPA